MNDLQGYGVMGIQEAIENLVVSFVAQGLKPPTRIALPKESLEAYSQQLKDKIAVPKQKISVSPSAATIKTFHFDGGSVELVEDSNA